VQFRRASLKLEVEPQITPDGRVVLDLDVAKDSVGEQTAGGPAINTKHVQTRVQVEDGGTVSIGGIYETDDREDVTRVPVLGKIPLWGALFRHRAHRDARSELVVFITPTVVQMNRCKKYVPGRRLDKPGALTVSCATNPTGIARGHRCKRGTHTPMFFL
jgi:type IV pilus assembly protein PilQ